MFRDCIVAAASCNSERRGDKCGESSGAAHLVPVSGPANFVRGPEGAPRRRASRAAAAGATPTARPIAMRAASGEGRRLAVIVELAAVIERRRVERRSPR